MDRHCPECNEVIRGRSDKKFCSDSCRNSHNNKLSRHVNNLVRNVNRLLSKNYRILAQLNPNGKSKTTREALAVKGFDFNHHTSIYETKKGGRYYFCYDQGYILLEDNHVALVKKYDDVNSL